MSHLGVYFAGPVRDSPQKKTRPRAPLPPHARVEKIRLREISLVPNPVNNKARVLQRELPSPVNQCTEEDVLAGRALGHRPRGSP